jgi:hypothetical protein
MKTEVTFTLSELREVVMSSWVDGWRNREQTTDNLKRDYWQAFLEKIMEEKK